MKLTKDQREDLQRTLQEDEDRFCDEDVMRDLCPEPDFDEDYTELDRW
jgi:hypothetical protein